MIRRWLTRLASKAEPIAENELSLVQIDRSYYNDVPFTPTADIPGATALLEWARGLVAGTEAPERMLETSIFYGRNLIVVSQDEVWARAALTQVAGEVGATVTSIAATDVARLDEATLASLDGPCVLLLEFGDWARESSDSGPDAAAALARVVSLISERDLRQSVFIAMVAPTLPETSQALRDVGGFDRFLLIAPRSDAEWGRYLLSRLEDRADSSLVETAALAGGMFSRTFETERRRDLAVLRLSRQAAARGSVSFSDLVELCVRGLVEGAPTLDPSERVRVAAHETGHVLVELLESEGTMIPEYASIIPTAHYSGVMMHAAERLVQDGAATTYSDLVQRTRVGLAGRAAEELLFGSAGISFGCENDLEQATFLVDRAFSRWGFGPGMDDPSRSGANLALVDEDAEKRTPSERERLAQDTREFLREQYTAALSMLQSHRPVFDDLRAELEQRGVLGREAFIGTAKRHGLAIAASVRKAA